jgi:CHASE2 domain-containing sensor protein
MNPASDPGHGHSPAAWTAVVIMLTSLSVGTVAFFLAQWWLVVVMAVLTLVGWGVGFLLAALGWGVNGPKYQPKEH